MKKLNILMKWERNFCSNFKISLPVRLQNYEKIKNIFFIGSYEFQMSYNEVDQGFDNNKLSQ